MSKLSKPYFLMTDNELSAEAWRRPAFGLPPVDRYDVKPLSYSERQKVINWLERNDSLFDSLNPPWKTGK